MQMACGQGLGRKQVVVLDRCIVLIKANRHGDVGAQPCIKAQLPAPCACRCHLTARKHQRDRELPIDREKLGLGVLLHNPAHCFDRLGRLFHNLGVHGAQSPIHREVMQIATLFVANQLVGSGEASEAIAVGGARGRIGCLIDQQST